MADIAQYDSKILDAVCQWPGCATYVARNILNDFGRGPNLTTAQVLRRLKSLEAAGRVERVYSSYLVMICWRPTLAEVHARGDRRG